MDDVMRQGGCACCDGAPHAGPRPGRRGLAIGALTIGALACAAVALPLAPAVGRVPATTLTPDRALARMQAGNAAWRRDTPMPASMGRDRREVLAGGQAPYCVILGCSDSRVPPELLFGAGLGDLFIIRNAGNTVDTAALGSIEYGVGVLGCPLVVVLGHEGCGAVAAAVEVVEHNASYEGVIGDMILPIIPAVLAARDAPGALLDAAVIGNARRTAGRLHRQSPLLEEAMRGGRLKIMAARYDLNEGNVAWFETV
ncbi:carbonic anhydrase [Humitalea rosea]|uniref:carbonic anhydrase n=2 Tax=Humitalea rosea TaxID=990373 RepID=A0A2W7K3I2_9PROT|nr:carbonic anhydrase [Humitalea rosea]